jgi:hypothetical protein
MVAFFQELLALEERIGNVSTGLSEEIVIKLLKQRKFSSWRLKASSDHEPCSICQVLISPGSIINSYIFQLAIGIQSEARIKCQKICQLDIDN